MFVERFLLALKDSLCFGMEGLPTPNLYFLKFVASE